VTNITSITTPSIETRGIALPKLGLGTWRLSGDPGRAAIESALALGYRHIDTAEMYGNEEEVGAALKASGIPRGEIHVTTKCWPDHLAPDDLRRAFDASLEKLKLDVVDLYLIHWPSRSMNLTATLEAMLKLKDEGRTRAIGVANFNIALLQQAVEEIGAPIACNQVEYHALLSQAKLLGYMRAQKIPLVAYTPLAKGRIAADPVLQQIARKHGATSVQVGLKWLLDQDGVCAIPKAARRESQQANLEALKLDLDDADRAAIAGLPKNERCVISGNAPDWD
jgi:2,5-diketo-D-gluconate reductase B